MQYHTISYFVCFEIEASLHGLKVETFDFCSVFAVILICRVISSLRATLKFQSQTVPDQHGRYGSSNWNFDFRNPEQSQFDMVRDESYVKADRKGG